MSVRILLTNDDGIYAPGLRALERELSQLGQVTVVAPAAEQSGVSHSITFLSPLICQEVYDEQDRLRGYAVEGSPADCVKLGIVEFCKERPDLVVSGINSGLNAGINVLYSGTVAAAIEGAFFGLMSVAVSLEYNMHADWERAARIARGVIEQIIEQQGTRPVLYNLNMPLAALHAPTDVRVVSMGVARYGEEFEKRIDPRGRAYYWATNEPPPPPSDEETDLSALSKGFVTLTPLHYDLTKRTMLEEMSSWNFRVSP